MKLIRFIFALTVGVFAVSLDCQGQKEDTAKRVYSIAAESVFLVYVNDSTGAPTALGSAFVVGSRTLVTNAHVVAKGTPVLAVGPVRIPVTVVRRDEGNDLALLKVDVDLTSAFLTLSDARPIPGERVYAIGNPEGLEKTISEGLISGVRHENGRELLQISSPISHGSSGGPVLDGEGRVVGVAVGLLPQGENLNFAVPVNFVRALVATISNASAIMPPTVTIARVRELLSARSHETYSSDESSGYQLANAGFKSSMHSAVLSARTDSDLRELACIGVGDWDAVDEGISAARKIYSVTTTPPNAAFLAYALYQEASLKDLAATFSKDGSDDKKTFAAQSSQLANEALAYVAKSKGSNGSEDQLAVFVRGAIAHMQGNFAVASPHLAKIVSSPVIVCENDLRAIALRDLIQENAGSEHFAEAEAWFKKYSQIYVPTAYEWDAEGDRRSDHKDYSLAADAYERASTMEKSLEYDLCYAAADRWLQPVTDEDKVLSDGRACMDASVRNSDAENAKRFEHEVPYVHLFMGRVLESRGVYSAALDNIKEALSALPNSHLALQTEADIFADTGKNQECVIAAQAAIAASDGKYSSDHFRLGYCYFAMDNWSMAASSFRRAV